MKCALSGLALLCLLIGIPATLHGAISCTWCNGDHASGNQCLAGKLTYIRQNGSMGFEISTPDHGAVGSTGGAQLTWGGTFALPAGAQQGSVKGLYTNFNGCDTGRYTESTMNWQGTSLWQSWAPFGT
jgi:hypothetical protein